MDSELRSILYRYAVVAVVLVGSVLWAVNYTTDNATVLNGAPIVLPPAEARAADAAVVASLQGEALCAEACRRQGACEKDDAVAEACSSACAVLMRDRPEQTTREARCILRALTCADLAGCHEG